MSNLASRGDLQRWAPLLVLVALIVFFTLVNPNFLSLKNFARISISATPPLMVAIGATFIIIMGSIDLSMEGSVAVCAVIFATLFTALGGTLGGWGWVALPACLIVGAICGLVTGTVHVGLRIPSFMASLSMGFVGIGLSLMMTGGDRIRVEDPLFRSLLTQRFLGFPLMVHVAFAVLLAAWFIQRKTTLGRNFYAVGGGEELAHASGLNVRRVRIAGFALAGVFYAFGALFAVAQLGIAETATGYNFMFVSITSIVVGGTALWGGSGGVWNTLVGVLIVNVINNGMIVMGLPRYVQDGVLGLLVIIAVVLSTDRKSLAFVK
ncbi:ABC transporter permease [Kaistia terrae]|uniref:Autoinducer 2 import system permease protein LsrD n=1 Tax=Kaistia terrae TaxID=537017 RepID=A0ABW0Q1P4_9HYPH|nr:ABC transporter permease [Kaistia terrae]MCX5579405.1 ABC transporter permease [Kaistia terrae]